MYVYMAMYQLLGAPGEHSSTQVFHTMQEHLHAWAPGPFWVGPLWAPMGFVGRAALVAPHAPLWAGPLCDPLGPHGLGPL